MSETSPARYWFVAIQVYRRGPPAIREVFFQHRIQLLRAEDAQQAYERALFMGRTWGVQSGWVFEGLHDLQELVDVLPAVADGKPQGAVGVEHMTEDRCVYLWHAREDQGWPITPKDQMLVFWDGDTSKWPFDQGPKLA